MIQKSHLHNILSILSDNTNSLIVKQYFGISIYIFLYKIYIILSVSPDFLSALSKTLVK